MELTQIDPYYDAGTASLSTSNRMMTGQETQWANQIVPGDQVYGADGRMGGIVETVNSNTSITLKRNWRGANQSAGGYTIYRVSDSVRVEQFSQRLLNLLLGSNVPAFAGLEGAANLLPFFTGAGAMDTTALTPFMRTLLDDANAGAARGTLDLGSMAIRSAGTGNDQYRDNVGNDGRFMRSSEYGFTNALTAPGDNANNISQPGIYALGNSTLNSPGSGNWLLFHMAQSSDLSIQIAYSRSRGNEAYMRAQVNGWQSWRPVVPERGSNSNGRWSRTGDGTQRCVHQARATYDNAGQLSYGWTMPASFVDVNYSVQVTMGERSPENVAQGLSRSQIQNSQAVNISRTTGLQNIAVYSNNLYSPGDYVWLYLSAEGLWY